VFKLGQHQSQTAIAQALLTAPFPGRSTLTSEGLRWVREQLFTTAAGARPTSANIPRVLVVLTDGASTIGTYAWLS
jgi:hypothetical protein